MTSAGAVGDSVGTVIVGSTLGSPAGTVGYSAGAVIVGPAVGSSSAEAPGITVPMSDSTASDPIMDRHKRFIAFLLKNKSRSCDVRHTTSIGQLRFRRVVRTFAFYKFEHS